MNKIKILTVFIIAAIVIAVSIIGFKIFSHKPDPESKVTEYFTYLANGEYESMYKLLGSSSKQNISQEDFITRNKNIYTGIEATNITINNLEKEDLEKGKAKVKYDMSMDTIAGKISFPNEIILDIEEKEYSIEWSSKLIFPNLGDDEKIKVSSISAKRGNIYDRNNVLLAGEGTVSSVGLVPGKMNENKEEDIKKIAELLEMSEEKINSLLTASYVKDDTFVAITNVSKNNYELKEKLLQIKGIMITDAKARVYDYGEQLAHLIGYVQTISAQELEEYSSKGYTSNSIIGKAGLEKVFEDRLRGKNGAEIYITDSQGNKKETVAQQKVENGEDIKLTLDVELQKYVYEQFKNDQGCAVLINPKTGEVLAICSTPSYDTNDYILGMTSSKWKNLSERADKPLYNRYQATFAPGSSFKPIIGAIALEKGIITANDDLGKSGTKWQKDSSWGTYYITTLTSYAGKANLQNALIYSDNIFFAKTALKIGAKTLASELNRIGFNKSINFEQAMSASQYANNNTFESETGLADTGYGQGQVLVNPVHIASIYSAFVNQGNMIKPYIEYQANKTPEYYIEGAFSQDTANTIKEDLIQVVENPDGTAHSAKIDGVKIAGKTGTAELKTSKDENGAEIGWFNCFIADENSSNQALLISMVDGVENKVEVITFYQRQKQYLRK